MNVKRACESSPVGADESLVSLDWLASEVDVPVVMDSLPRPTSGPEVAVESGRALTPVSSESSAVFVALAEEVEVEVLVLELSLSELPVMTLLANPVFC